MTDPFTEHLTLDQLRTMTGEDLKKYRTRSWVNEISSLPRADLEHLAAGQPDQPAWDKGPAAYLAGAILGDPGAGIDELARSGIRQHPRQRQQIEAGRDLAARFGHPGLQRTLKTMLDELEERSDGTRADLARLATAQRLKALQLFTYAARVPAGAVCAQHDFVSAASFLSARGDRFGTAILLGFARDVSPPVTGNPYASGSNVYADHTRWAGRLRHWQALAAADPSPAVPAGRARRGADGSAYTIDQRTVTVRSAGGQAETVTFAAHDDAAGWLANRVLAGVGPLLTTVGGPACRTAREDEILAALLHDPDDAELHHAADGIFTSHLRAELHRTLTLCPPGHARDRFAAAMLRAPGWALGAVGCDARRAVAYLDRLAATPVSPAQAREAVIAVGEEAAHAENRWIDSLAPRPARRRRTPSPSRRVAASQRPLLAPPPPVPAPVGPVPRA